jgi:hypothetical protein
MNNLKKFSLVTLCLFSMVGILWGAGTKLSDLTTKSTPIAADLIPLFDTEEALPADQNKKITLGTIPAANSLITGKPEITVGDSGYATFAAAVAAISTTSATLVVPATVAETIAADLVCPATLAIKVLKGASLTVANTKTLTINGPLESGPYQIFSLVGTGAVVFGNASCDKYYPNWFGFSTAAAAATNSAAMAATIAAVAHDSNIVIPNGVYNHAGFTINKPIIVSGAAGKYASLGGTVLTGATIGSVLVGTGTVHILGGATTSKLYNAGLAGISLNYTGATGNALQIENAIWTTLRDMKIISSGDKGLYITGNTWTTRIDNLYMALSKNSSIGIHTDNAGGGAQTRNVVIQVIGGATGITKVKVEGASAAQSAWHNLDAGAEDATGIGFHLYHTNHLSNCDLHTPRFECIGGTAIKVEAVGGGTDLGKLNVFGGHITGADIGFSGIHSMGCTFNGTRFGRSVAGVFANIAATCYGTTFINCNDITSDKANITDAGNYTTIINAAQTPYTQLFQAISTKNPCYRKSLAPICGVSSAYGDEVTIAPASGYTQLIPRYVKITVASISGETVRVKLIGHKDDATDIDPVIEHDFAGDGSYIMTNEEMMVFFTDAKYLISIGAQAYTTDAGAGPTVSVDLVMRQE